MIFVCNVYMHEEELCKDMDVQMYICTYFLWLEL